jgi:hypothetical protein
MLRLCSRVTLALNLLWLFLTLLIAVNVSAQTPVPALVGTLGVADATVTQNIATSTSAVIQVSGTWSGTITFEASADGNAWTSTRVVRGSTLTVVSTTTANDTYFTSNPGYTAVRARMSSYTSGIAFVAIKGGYGAPATPVDTTLTNVNIGAKNGSAVTVVEQGDGVWHQTVFTLTDLAIVQVDNGANASGGAKIYTFPEGYLQHIGTVVNLSLVTDAGATATFVGGIGTVTAAADGTLTGTEQDFIPSTAFTAAASLATFAVISTATEEVRFDGTATAKALYLNFADADDVGGAAVHVHCTGTITVTWIFKGDKTP